MIVTYMPNRLQFSFQKPRMGNIKFILELGKQLRNRNVKSRPYSQSTWNITLEINKF